MGQAVIKAGHPVFSSPAGESHMEARSRPVDLVHLARQTGGNRNLEEEVLQMFLRQAHKLTREMAQDCDCETRKLAAHNLKGAARAVGAFNVANCADDLENNPSEVSYVSTLTAEVNTTCDYISSLLR
ncbi:MULTISPECIES: Hpt domain-containing protein [Ahrensia]|uniref:Hpt domain-containing protein n=1 Tax=Ahrensia TaxID=152180 RepID=UPI0009DEE50A|nr:MULTISPECIES: Hpt domain-containing protein [Ahrensia]